MGSSMINHVVYHIVMTCDFVLHPESWNKQEDSQMIVVVTTMVSHFSSLLVLFVCLVLIVPDYYRIWTKYSNLFYPKHPRPQSSMLMQAWGGLAPMDERNQTNQTLKITFANTSAGVQHWDFFGLWGFNKMCVLQACFISCPSTVVPYTWFVTSVWWSVMNLSCRRADTGIYRVCPLVDVYITIENHHFEWVNQLLWQFSIAMSDYRRVVLFHLLFKPALALVVNEKAAAPSSIMVTCWSI